MQPDEDSYHENPLERAHIRQAIAPTVTSAKEGRHPRVLATMALGLLAVVCGVLAFFLSQPVLGLAAGVIGSLAAVATLSIDGDRQRVADENSRLSGQVEQLETALTNERGRVQNPASKSVEPAEGAVAKGSSLVEARTGLFTEEYFTVTLDARVAAARRNLRPVSVVLLEVMTGVSGGAPQASDSSAVAEGIRATLREADTPCIMDDGIFGLLLEDTPENGAVWTVERLRRRLANDKAGQTLWAGVACYPAHAFTAAEILEQARVALRSAREWRQDRIEVAVGEP